jgi:hypothetical protein
LRQSQPPAARIPSPKARVERRQSRWKTTGELATLFSALMAAGTAALAGPPFSTCALAAACLLAGPAWLFRRRLSRISPTRRDRLIRAGALSLGLAVAATSAFPAGRDVLIHDVLRFPRSAVTIRQVLPATRYKNLSAAAPGRSPSGRGQAAEPHAIPSAGTPTSAEKVPSQLGATGAAPAGPGAVGTQPKPQTPSGRSSSPEISPGLPASPPAPASAGPEGIRQYGVMATFGNSGPEDRTINTIDVAYRTSQPRQEHSEAITFLEVRIPTGVSVAGPHPARGTVSETHGEGKSEETVETLATVKVTCGRCEHALVEFHLHTDLKIGKHSSRTVLVTATDSRIPVIGIDENSLKMTIFLDDGSSVAKDGRQVGSAV